MCPACLTTVALGAAAAASAGGFAAIVAKLLPKRRSLENKP